MKPDEWKAIVLHKMGLTSPMSAREICLRHNGVQAQFQTYADEGFKSRMSRADFAGDWSGDLVRQWSIRGTVHAYLKEEIPLYLYEGRNYCRPSLAFPSRDGRIPAEEKKYYARLILDSLRSGNKDREELKAVCRGNGLTQEKEKSLFNAWGGIIASLVSEGLIYQEYGRRAFGLLQGYRPADQETAELEIARRYFSGFGPVTMADARYYFKENKAVIEKWMKKLDLNTAEVDGKTRFYCGELPSPAGIPEVLLVAGFDAVLLVFEKRENPFFDPQHIRDIYTMTGILKPTVMLNGQLAATWRREKGTIYIKPFRKIKAAEKKRIASKAAEDGASVCFE